MTQGEPIAVFERDWKPAVWGSLILVPVFVVVAVLVRGDVAAALGTGDIVAVVVLSGGLSVATVLVAAHRARSRGPVAFYQDSLAVDGEIVGYDQVAVAVHQDADVSDDAVGDTGTGSFELFVPGGDVVRFAHVEDPESVVEILADRIPAPADRVDPDAAPADDGGREPVYIETPRRFWDYWRADRALPETAVVGDETLKDALAVDAYELEKLDGVDVRAADGLSDFNQYDLISKDRPSARHE